MIRKTFGALALLAMASVANAAHYVEIQAPAQVAVGDQFTVEIYGDFLSLGLIAGGVQLSYDAGLLSLDSFSTPLNVDAALSCPGANNCPNDAPGTYSIVWGQFLSDLIAPDAGPTLMATITMTALAAPAQRGAGNANLVLSDFSGFTGGWFGAGFSPIETPALLNASLTITDPTVIPLPAAVWFMIGGLGALAGFRRK